MTRRVAADSSANLYASDLPDFSAVPLKIVTAEREYTDDAALDAAAMLQEMEAYKGRSSTACPSVADWLAAFGDAEEVFAVTLTSALSGCYNAACIASAEYMRDNPGRRVFLFDSLSTGPEMELIAGHMARLAASTRSFEEICEQTRAYAARTHLLFSLESLSNFAKNGRVSHVLAKAVGLLGIRIVGRASAEGELEPLHKCRGEKRAVAKLYEEMLAAGFDGGRVRIRHSFNPEGAAQLERMISEDYPACNVKTGENRGLCSYYAEKGGILVGFESRT